MLSARVSREISLQDVVVSASWWILSHVWSRVGLCSEGSQMSLSGGCGIQICLLTFSRCTLLQTGK